MKESNRDLRSSSKLMKQNCNQESLKHNKLRQQILKNLKTLRMKNISLKHLNVNYATEETEKKNNILLYLKTLQAKGKRYLWRKIHI